MYFSSHSGMFVNNFLAYIFSSWLDHQHFSCRVPDFFLLLVILIKEFLRFPISAIEFGGKLFSICPMISLPSIILSSLTVCLAALLLIWESYQKQNIISGSKLHSTFHPCISVLYPICTGKASSKIVYAQGFMTW
jgi:hypothetical protein